MKGGTAARAAGLHFRHDEEDKVKHTAELEAERKHKEMEKQQKENEKKKAHEIDKNFEAALATFAVDDHDDDDAENDEDFEKSNNINKNEETSSKEPTAQQTVNNNNKSVGFLLGPGDDNERSKNNHPSSSSPTKNSVTISGDNDHDNKLEDDQDHLAKTTHQERKYLYVGRRVVINMHEEALYLFDRYNCFRVFCIDVIDSWVYDAFIVLTVLVSVASFVMDSPAARDLEGAAAFAEYSEYAIQGIYAVELIIKIIALGFVLHPYSYLRDPLRFIEAVIVAGGFAAIPLTGGWKTLRNLKLIRLMHALERLMKYVPELRGVFDALRASQAKLRDLTALYFIVVVAMSILGLQLFNGAFQQRCFITTNTSDPNAGSDFTVLDPRSPNLCTIDPTNGGSLCLEGAKCGTNSGQYVDAYLNFDNIGNAVFEVFKVTTMTNWWEEVKKVQFTLGASAALYPIAIVLLCAFGIMNFFVAILSTEYEIAAEGHMSHSDESFFEALLYSMHTSSLPDAYFLDSFLFGKARLWVYKNVTNTVQMKWISVFITFINILSLAIFAYNLPGTVIDVCDWVNFLCGVYFVLEAIVRIFTWGGLYFKAFINLFDLLLASLAVVEIAVVQTKSIGSVFASLRALRALSIFRLAINFERARQLLVTLAYATRTSFLMFLLILAYVAIFAIFGVYLFGTAVPTSIRPNFTDLKESILAMFIVLTSENWVTIARSAMVGSSGAAAAFFCIFFFIGNYVLVNFFLVIVITCYSRAAQQFDHAYLDKKIKAAIAKIDDQVDDEEFVNISYSKNDPSNNNNEVHHEEEEGEDDELAQPVQLSQDELQKHLEMIMGEVQTIEPPAAPTSEEIQNEQEMEHMQPTRNADALLLQSTSSKENGKDKNAADDDDDDGGEEQEDQHQKTGTLISASAVFGTSSQKLKSSSGDQNQLLENTLNSTTNNNNSTKNDQTKRSGLSVLQLELALVYERQKLEEKQLAEEEEAAKAEEEEKKRKEQEQQEKESGGGWWGSLGTIFKSAVQKTTTAVRSAIQVPSGVAAAAKKLARVHDEEELDDLGNTLKKPGKLTELEEIEEEKKKKAHLQAGGAAAAAGKQKKDDSDSTTSSDDDDDEHGFDIVDDDDTHQVKTMHDHEDHFDLGSTTKSTSTYDSFYMSNTDGGTSSSGSTTFDNYSDTLLAVLASQSNLAAHDFTEEEQNEFLRQKHIDLLRKQRQKKRAQLTGDEGSESADDSGFSLLGTGGGELMHKAISIWQSVAGSLGIEYSKSMDPQKIVRKGCWGEARKQHAKRENVRKQNLRIQKKKEREAAKRAKQEKIMSEQKTKAASNEPFAQNDENSAVPSSAVATNSKEGEDSSSPVQENEKINNNTNAADVGSSSSPNQTTARKTVTIVVQHDNEDDDDAENENGPRSLYPNEDGDHEDGFIDDEECCCSCCCGIRYYAAVTVYHPLFDIISFLAVLDACITVGFNSDIVLNSFSSDARFILDANIYTVTGWFCFESLLKLIALSPEYYVKGIWNVYDGIVAVLSFVAIFVPSIAFLRVLWIVRLVAKWHPQKKILTSLAQSLNGILNVAILLLVTMLTFAILGVHVFSGQWASCNDKSISNKTACVGTYFREQNFLDRDANVANLTNLIAALPILTETARQWKHPFFNYNNLGEGFVSNFVVLWGDGWSGLLFQGMDSTDTFTSAKQGWRWESVVFFVLFTFVGNLVMKNLFVSALLESFATERLRDLGYIDKYKRRLLTSEQETWIRNFRFARTVETTPQPAPPTSWFRKLACRIYFSDYDRAQVRKEFEFVVVCCILLNVAFMSSEFSEMPQYWKDTLYGQSLAFAGIYCIEVIISFTALTPIRFFKDGWQLFNLVIITTAFLGILLPGTGRQVFQVVRVLRILRVIRRSPGLYRFFEAVVYALPQVVNVTITFILVLYVFGVTATSLFESIYIDESDPASVFSPYFNYRHAGFSMATLVQGVTTSGWAIQMQAICEIRPESTPCTNEGGNCGSYAAIPFFIIFMSLGQSIFVNLYIFVIVSSFLEMNKLHEVESQWLFAMLRDFRSLWSHVDPEGLNVVPWDVFVRVMERLIVLERDLAGAVRKKVGVPTKMIRGSSGELILVPLIDSGSAEKHSAEGLEAEMAAYYDPDTDEALQVQPLTHKQRALAFSVFAAFGAVDMSFALKGTKKDPSGGGLTMTTPQGNNEDNNEEEGNNKNDLITSPTAAGEGRSPSASPPSLASSSCGGMSASSMWTESIAKREEKRRERALFLRIRAMAIPTLVTPFGPVVKFNDCLFGITRSHAGVATKNLTARAKKFISKLRPHSDDRNFKVHHAMAAKKIVFFLKTIIALRKASRMDEARYILNDKLKNDFHMLKPSKEMNTSLDDEEEEEDENNNKTKNKRGDEKEASIVSPLLLRERLASSATFASLVLENSKNGEKKQDESEEEQENLQPSTKQDQHAKDSKEASFKNNNGNSTSNSFLSASQKKQLLVDEKLNSTTKSDKNESSSREAVIVLPAAVKEAEKEEMLSTQQQIVQSTHDEETTSNEQQEQPQAEEKSAAATAFAVGAGLWGRLKTAVASTAKVVKETAAKHTSASAVPAVSNQDDDQQQQQDEKEGTKIEIKNDVEADEKKTSIAAGEKSTLEQEREPSTAAVITSPTNKNQHHHHHHQVEPKPPLDEIEHPEEDAYVVVYAPQFATRPHQDGPAPHPSPSSRLCVSIIACGIEWAVWKGAICRRPFDPSRFTGLLLSAKQKDSNNDDSDNESKKTVENGTQQPQIILSRSSQQQGAPDPPPFFLSAQQLLAAANSLSSSSLKRKNSGLPLLRSPTAANNNNNNNTNDEGSIENAETKQDAEDLDAEFAAVAYHPVSIARIGSLLPNAANGIAKKVKNLFTTQVLPECDILKMETVLDENRKFVEVFGSAIVNKIEAQEWAPSLFKKLELERLLKLFK